MSKKINRIIKFRDLFFFILIFLLLIFTRFIGLDWGLPYPMHPDERNMANSVQELNCDISNLKFQISNLRQCFNPHFYAYGQFSLYFGYLISLILKLFNKSLDTAITFEEATISLRIISAITSFLTAIVIVKIIENIINKKIRWYFWLLIIFSPFFIQYSHFGTTESLLIFFYIFLIYLSFIYFDNKLTDFNFLFLSSLILGLSLATKISSGIFIIVPIYSIFKKNKLNDDIFFINFIDYFFKNFFIRIISLIFFLFLTFFFFFVFSPHNFINFNDFINSMNYESSVGFGKYIVFYTQQFEKSIPYIFQIIKIFPWVLGAGISLISLIGIIGLSWKDKKINLLRLAFFVYFLLNGFFYAKWTRFMAPVFPILLIFGILFLIKLKIKNIYKFFIILILIIPGIIYLLIYLKPDIRFQASEWIFKNIPENSYVLSETANVIDVPIVNPKSKIQNQKYINYNLISFDFYNLDGNQTLQKDLENHLKNAQYIIVPSRRIFANYTCLWPEKKNFLDDFVYEKNRCQELEKKFPLLNDYYKKLFLGELGFKLIKKFSPFSFDFFEFDDEVAEETWSVFDHPVIRIYKKIKS
ncbi:MAG: glycosyltransferase family 39 protein [Patescibacteria group bacterium]|nr:glycosyltransferase family 39 protein [Patescibacteria group bacterium]